MDIDPRFRRSAMARRFSWLILVGAGWVLSAPACSPSNETVVVTGNGGSGGTVDASADHTSTGGSVATGGTAGAPRGGGGSAGTGGTLGTGGVAEGGTGGVAEAASDVIVYVCPDGGNPNQDTDSDGVPDCVDGCPLDQLKQAPGICGCNMSDADSDGDGRPDCQDNCPMDVNKFDPGICGCGNSDTQDSDGDHTVDCLDGCPHNGNLTAPGVCGCLDIVGDILCLAHRYSFNDAPGTAVAADTGHGPAANGTVIGTTVLRGDAGNGFVALAGVTSDQYVSLPANTISSLGDSATFEAWMTWNPVNASAWQRVFDFGSSTGGPGMQGNGVTYLFLTPRSGPGTLRAAFTLNGGGAAEDLVENIVLAPNGVITHVAVVVDGAAHNMKLYLNGAVVPANSTGVTMRAGYTLSHLNDVNNWLGRSQWAPDEEFAGTIHEFRIYSRALPPEQLLANAAAGPEVVPAAVFDAGTPGNPDAATDAASDARADAPEDTGAQ